MIENKNIQIKLDLQYLCQGNPIVCKKQNQSGIGSSSRIIYAKRGVFEYYNNKSNFKLGQPIMLVPEHFKASIKLQDIYQCQFLPKNSDKKNILSLILPQIKVLYKRPLDKIPDKTYLIKWVFIFEFDILELINRRRQEERQRLAYQAFLQQQKNKEAQSPLRKSSAKVSQYSEQNEQKKSLEQYVQALKKMKNYLKMKQNLQKQQNDTKRKRIEQNQIDNIDQNQQKQDNQYQFSHFWREYTACYDIMIKSKAKKDLVDNIQYQLEFLKELSFFKEQATNLIKQYINQKLVGWRGETYTMQGYNFYRGAWIKVGGKQLNQQFMANLYLADILYNMENIKKIKFKVPLLALSTYKGFKILLMIDMPFKILQKSILYTPLNEKITSDFGISRKIKQALQFLQKLINIKCEPMIKNNTKNAIPLGKNIFVMQYSNKKDNTINLAQVKNNIENFYYLSGVQAIYPMDFNYVGKQNQCWLRPQLIFQFRDKLEAVYNQDPLLCSQAFMQSKTSLQFKNSQDLKVAKASTYLLNYKIPELVNKLNNLQIIYLDSLSIKQSFSQFGINIRYIYEIYNSTEIPYLKETLRAQVLGRTIKRLYRHHMKELISISGDFTRRLLKKQDKKRLPASIKNQTQILANHAIDFLNLIFGIDTETQAFWEIIIQKCLLWFQIQVTDYKKIRPGLLLHAVLWHCQFIINFTSNIPLFKKNQPFKIENWIEFGIDVKVYNFPSLQINHIVRKFGSMKFSQRNELLQKIGFNLLKLDLLFNFTVSSDVQVTLSKMNNFKDKLQKPSREVPLHPIEISYYIANKSQGNFQRALEIMNFSLAENHPLYLSLYKEYSEFIEPQLLKKTCILASIQGLGQFHPKTTQLYSQFYRQGFTQFQVKALRQKNIAQIQQICINLFKKLKYQSCLAYCLKQIDKKLSKQIENNRSLQSYLQILIYGIYSANYTTSWNQGIKLSLQFSEIASLYKVKDPQKHQIIFKETLIIKMSCSTHKYYLYKMVLLAVHIEQQHQGLLPRDSNGLRRPCQGHQKQVLLKGVIQQYYLQETHAKFIDYIFTKLISGFMYFNYLQNLFSNYQYHLDNYQSQSFKQSLGYLHIFIKLFGQALFKQHLYEIK